MDDTKPQTQLRKSRISFALGMTRSISRRKQIQFTKATAAVIAPSSGFTRNQNVISTELHHTAPLYEQLVLLTRSLRGQAAKVSSAFVPCCLLHHNAEPHSNMETLQYANKTTEFGKEAQNADPVNRAHAPMAPAITTKAFTRLVRPQGPSLPLRSLLFHRAICQYCPALSVARDEVWVGNCAYRTLPLVSAISHSYRLQLQLQLQHT